MSRMDLTLLYKSLFGGGNFQRQTIAQVQVFGTLNFMFCKIALGLVCKQPLKAWRGNCFVFKDSIKDCL